jgi:hypothetical protein
MIGVRATLLPAPDRGGVDVADTPRGVVVTLGPLSLVNVELSPPSGAIGDTPTASSLLAVVVVVVVGVTALLFDDLSPAPCTGVRARPRPTNGATAASTLTGVAT